MRFIDRSKVEVPSALRSTSATDFRNTYMRYFALDEKERAQTRVSIRGAMSIQVYGLNRLGLVQERTRLLRHLEFLRQTIIEIDTVARDLEAFVDPAITAATYKLDRLIDRILAEINEMSKPHAPYSALVTHWKRRFLEAL